MKTSTLLLECATSGRNQDVVQKTKRQRQKKGL